MTAEVFTEEVLSRLVAEHGAPRSTFEYLIPKITAAHSTEGSITQEQMNELIHGGEGGGGVSEDLQKQFPLLNAICLSPYTDVDDQSLEHEKIDDEDEDDDDDDVESEEEDED